MDKNKIKTYISRHYYGGCFMHIAYSYLLMNSNNDLAYRFNDLATELHGKSSIPLWTELSPLYNKEGNSNG